MDYVLTFAVGVGAGVLLEKALAKMNASTIASRSEALRACFGEPMCTITMTLEEVKEWISARKDLFSDGSKCIVCKVNNDTLKSVGRELNVSGVESYLLIAFVSPSSDLRDSILIKYEKLGQDLEEVLAKGNGTMVVEG